MTDLRRQGADAYILDLRDNPGGLVQAGVEIARLFLPPDATIAYTEGRVVAGGAKRDTDVSATKKARNGSDSNLPHQAQSHHEHQQRTDGGCGCSARRSRERSKRVGE